MPSQPAPSFLTHVAANVRDRRRAAGLSQKALAEASGVSPRMIGGIESGATSVSTATLDRIGVILHATLSDLVREPGTAHSRIVDRLGWQGTHGGTGVLRSSVSVSREVETWEWTLNSGDRYQAGADPQGWHVLVVVVEGELDLELTDATHRIKAGSLLFDSAQKHAFANRGRMACRFFRMTLC